MCPETFVLWDMDARILLQKMLKMYSMRVNARLDTFHHGPTQPFEDAWVVADSLAGIHNAMVKCRFIVNRSCVHTGFYVSPQVKILRIQIWRGAWRPCSGSSSTYPSVMTGVTENISHSTEPRHACTTFVLWLPVVHVPVALADQVRGNLGSGCL
jgi:hypothetical protein